MPNDLGMELGLWFVGVFALIGGLLAARLGIGVSPIMAPVLIVAPGVSVREALGAALLAEVFVQAASLSTDDRMQAVDQTTFRQLAALAAGAGVVGAGMIGMLGDSSIKVLVGVIAGLIGIVFFFDLDPEEEDARIAAGWGAAEPAEPRAVSAFGETFSYRAMRLDEAKSVAVGGGVVAGLLGTGQIEVHRLSLLRRQRIPSVVTTATALMLGLVTAFAAGVTHLLLAVIADASITQVSSLLVFIVAGSSVGALASRRLPSLPGEIVLKGLGVFVLLLGCFTIATGLIR